jgi:hypothetical protein
MLSERGVAFRWSECCRIVTAEALRLTARRELKITSTDLALCQVALPATEMPIATGSFCNCEVVASVLCSTTATAVMGHLEKNEVIGV